MGLNRNYFAGIVIAAVGILGGTAYFGTQVGSYQGEKVVGSTNVDNVTVRVIEEDRKWCPDDFRIEVLDRDGNTRVRFQGQEHFFNRAEIIDKGGLEGFIPF